MTKKRRFIFFHQWAFVRLRVMCRKKRYRQKLGHDILHYVSKFWFFPPPSPWDFLVHFNVYLGLGKILWPNVQKVLPENVPTLLKYPREKSAPKACIFMKCTENLAQNCAHLYGIYRTNFIQRYTSFLKICKILTGKMLPTLIKCTENRMLNHVHLIKCREHAILLCFLVHTPLAENGFLKYTL